MMAIVGILLAVGAGLWFGRRLGPALVAAVIALAGFLQRARDAVQALAP